MQHKLSSVDHVGITTDLWTSDSTNYYITVTIHFIENAGLHASALQTSEVKGSQTASQIVSELIDILNNWKINQKIVIVVLGQW